MKVEINTLYISEERVPAMLEATKGKGVKVLPLGIQQELISGVTYYTSPKADSQESESAEEPFNRPNLDIRKQFEKIYLNR